MRDSAFWRLQRCLLVQKKVDGDADPGEGGDTTGGLCCSRRSNAPVVSMKGSGWRPRVQGRCLDSRSPSRVAIDNLMRQWQSGEVVRECHVRWEGFILFSWRIRRGRRDPVPMHQQREPRATGIDSDGNGAKAHIANPDDPRQEPTTRGCAFPAYRYTKADACLLAIHHIISTRGLVCR